MNKNKQDVQNNQRQRFKNIWSFTESNSENI